MVWGKGMERSGVKGEEEEGSGRGELSGGVENGS